MCFFISSSDEFLLKLRSSFNIFARNVGSLAMCGFCILLKFLKRTSAKKINIELKPIKSKYKQVKFKSTAPSNISSQNVPSNKILSPKRRPIPPLEPPLLRRNSELSPFIDPASLISPDLDKKSTEFRRPYAISHRAHVTIPNAK